MKKLKTGDVRLYKRCSFVPPHHRWATVDMNGFIEGWCIRRSARHVKRQCERIAKILKMTPKTVTVQISK